MYSIELQTVFYEYQNKNHKIKTGFNLKIFHFDIRGKLSILRCDKYILNISFLAPHPYIWAQKPEKLLNYRQIISVSSSSYLRTYPVRHKFQFVKLII